LRRSGWSEGRFEPKRGKTELLVEIGLVSGNAILSAGVSFGIGECEWIAGKRGKGWYVGEYGLLGRGTLSKKEEKSFPS
jgi:hypothetical protein